MLGCNVPEYFIFYVVQPVRRGQGHQILTLCYVNVTLKLPKEIVHLLIFSALPVNIKAMPPQNRFNAITTLFSWKVS